MYNPGKEEHDMSNEWLPLVVRVYRSSQQHILETMKLFKDRVQKSEFLDSINDMNMELLDSLTHRLLPSKKHQAFTKISPWPTVAVLDPFKPESEQAKNIGLELIKNRKGMLMGVMVVMVLIMAAGAHLSYGDENMQIQPLDELPSKRCLLEIQLGRCNTIAELLGIKLEVIVVTATFKSLLNRRLKLCRYKHLVIHEISQFHMGLVDTEGRLLMKSPDCLYRQPNGTGDILARLAEQNMLQYALDKKVEYLSVVASNSLLDPMLDCLALGRMHIKNLNCLAKAVDGEVLPQHTRIVELEDRRIYMIDIKEYHFYSRNAEPSREQVQAYLQSPGLSNSFIFRFSYLDSLVKSEDWNNSENRLYRVKIAEVPTYNPIGKNLGSQPAILFEKDITDIFNFTDRFQVVRIVGQPYAPIVTEDSGSCSQEQAILKLSDLNKSRLGLKNTDRHELCQIGEQVSVWGQNLTDIASQLLQQPLNYPLHIHQF